jgi:hypothetical protein
MRTIEAIVHVGPDRKRESSAISTSGSRVRRRKLAQIPIGFVSTGVSLTETTADPRRQESYPVYHWVRFATTAEGLADLGVELTQNTIRFVSPPKAGARRGAVRRRCLRAC